MQRKEKRPLLQIRASSQKPSKASLSRFVAETQRCVPVLLISKAPVHRFEPKQASASDLQAENALLRRRSSKLASIFKELKNRFITKRDQLRRLRDIAEFAGVLEQSELREASSIIRDPLPVAESPAPLSESAALLRHLHRLEQAVTKLRLELYRAKQEYDRLSSWLGRMGLSEHSEYFTPAFDVDSMSYEELLALEERIGYVKVGLSESDRARLPTVAISNASQEDLCCVCLQQFEEGTVAKRLPSCGHTFHGACIDEWLDMRKTCPLCVVEVQV